MTAPAGSEPGPVGWGAASLNWPALAVRKALLADPGGPGASGFAACALTGELQAAARARRFTRNTLESWGLAELSDNALLIVSELLNNAMRHGLSGPRQHPGPTRPVWLGLLRRGAFVLVTVCDPSTQVPVLRDPDDFAESGRGLHIIDSLSESWGWTPPDAHGKSVWAMVSASTPGPH
jgi:hypothetical protein